MRNEVFTRGLTSLFAVVEALSTEGGVEAAKRQLADAIQTGVAASLLPNAQYQIQPVPWAGQQKAQPRSTPLSASATQQASRQRATPRASGQGATPRGSGKPLKPALQGAVRSWQISATPATAPSPAQPPAIHLAQVSPGMTQSSPPVGSAGVPQQMTLKDAEALLDAASASGSPQAIMLALAQYSAAEGNEKAAQLKAMGYAPKQVAMALADWKQNEREQTYQMMSNISASQHRTAMGIIGNMRG